MTYDVNQIVEKRDILIFEHSYKEGNMMTQCYLITPEDNLSGVVQG